VRKSATPLEQGRAWFRCVLTMLTTNWTTSVVTPSNVGRSPAAASPAAGAPAVSDENKPTPVALLSAAAGCGAAVCGAADCGATDCGAADGCLEADAAGARVPRLPSNSASATVRAPPLGGVRKKFTEPRLQWREERSGRLHMVRCGSSGMGTHPLTAHASRQYYTPLPLTHRMPSCGRSTSTCRSARTYRGPSGRSCKIATV
jgi:hypothetical protein